MHTQIVALNEVAALYYEVRATIETKHRHYKIRRRLGVRHMKIRENVPLHVIMPTRKDKSNFY